MFASAQNNHWENDDYTRYMYLSDLFWDDMFDTCTAPGMREA